MLLPASKLLDVLLSESPSVGQLSALKDKAVVYISPHPDDVELACGALMRRTLERGLSTKYICVTDGDPLDRYGGNAVVRNRLGKHYSCIRRAESRRALARLGLNLCDAIYWTFPDLALCEHIDRLIDQLASVTRDACAVVCCPFEGGHPDHDISRFALAVLRTRRKQSFQVIEYASYNRQGYQVFLDPSGEERTLHVTGHERKLKEEVANMFQSQKIETHRFSTLREEYRPTEPTDALKHYTRYRKPPHYERFAHSAGVVLRAIREYIANIEKRGLACNLC
jgi:LmbE family N-acetylglucosaminyl deacetylase